MAGSEASKKLNALGFKVSQTSRVDPSPYGTVITQSITGPTAPGARIALSVSSSRAPVVPSPSQPTPPRPPITVVSGPGQPPITLAPGAIVPGIPPP